MVGRDPPENSNARHERAPTLGPPALGAPRSDLSDRGSALANEKDHLTQGSGLAIDLPTCAK